MVLKPAGTRYALSILFSAVVALAWIATGTTALAEHVIIDPNDPSTYGGSLWDGEMEKARVALESKDYKGAQALASKALTLTSDSKEKAYTYAMMSAIALAGGKFDEALKHNDAALAIFRSDFPDDVETQYGLLSYRAEILVTAGRREEWGKVITQAFAILNTKKDVVWTLEKGQPAVHKLTGLVCPLKLKGASFQDAGIFSLSGDDVACSYEADSQNGVHITFYFARRKNGQTLDQDFDATVLEIGLLYGGAKPSSSTQRSVSGKTVREAIYNVSNEQGESAGSGLWASDLDGWTLKARISQSGQLDLSAARSLVDEFFASARKSAKNTSATAATE